MALLEVFDLRPLGEVALGKRRRGKQRRPQAYARWTGVGIEDLVARQGRRLDILGLAIAFLAISY